MKIHKEFLNKKERNINMREMKYSRTKTYVKNWSVLMFTSLTQFTNGRL